MKCPFCNAEDESCEHLLLTVDNTFRQATNGALYDRFSDEWATVWEREGDDFDEYIEFENLLDAVNSCADAEEDGEFEGGPGQSSSLRSYYCKTIARVDEAVKEFNRNMDDSFASQILAKNAIEHAMQWVSEQKGKCSLDEVVQQLRQQPGVEEVIDQRPLVMIIKFADGSGVGVSQKGLDLLEPSENRA